MVPARLARKCGRIARVTSMAPKTLTSNWARIAAGEAASKIVISP